MLFKVINTFKNHYINPFDPFLEKETLYNLSSGAAMPAEVTEYLLLLHEKGNDLCNNFLQSRILTTTKRFHDKFTRNNNKMILTKKLIPSAHSNKEPNNIDINRNVLGQLVSYSLKSDYKIDLGDALKYRLAKIPLSLCYADGTKRSSPKLDLLKALNIQCSPADVIQDYQQCSFALDVMAAIVTVGKFAAIEELTWKIVNTIPTGCKRVDLVADNYRKEFWKTQRVKIEALENKL